MAGARVGDECDSERGAVVARVGAEQDHWWCWLLAMVGVARVGAARVGGEGW